MIRSLCPFDDDRLGIVWRIYREHGSFSVEDSHGMIVHVEGIEARREKLGLCRFLIDKNVVLQVLAVLWSRRWRRRAIAQRT